MDICTTTVPPALDLHDVSGHREVLCWLQDGAHDVPPELALVPPVAGSEAARPSMRVHGTPLHAPATTEGGITDDN
jgi:hypothetical protein